MTARAIMTKRQTKNIQILNLELLYRMSLVKEKYYCYKGTFQIFQAIFGECQLAIEAYLVTYCSERIS